MPEIIDESKIRYIENGEPHDQTVYNRPVRDLVTEVNIKLADPSIINRPKVVTGEVDFVSGNLFTASVEVLAFGSVGAGSLLVGLRYREDGDPDWTEGTPTAVSALDTYPVTVSDLDPNKTYQFQAFGRNALNPDTFVVGEVRTVLTAGEFIETPSVSVEGSPNDVIEIPTITVSPFSVFGGSDTYLRSEVKVFKDGVEIWSNENAVIGSPWTWVLPSDILTENTSGYRIDVRHVGSTLGVSNWGQSALFSTMTEFPFAYPGEPFGGGFYAGANIVIDGQEYALVVAPRSQGGLSSETLQWKTGASTTSGTDSRNDGLANSNNMNDTDHPAAHFCRGLNINGHDDWYLPSQDELEICYRYLKPTTNNNGTSGIAGGDNPSSNPVGTTYTAGDPSQTSISIFQEGGGEDFRIDSTTRYWPSTQSSASHGRYQSFVNGVQGTNTKTVTNWVRAVRKVAV